MPGVARVRVEAGECVEGKVWGGTYRFKTLAGEGGGEKREGKSRI